MAAYYNENDPKTAAWLRELIKEKLIADGEVDTRSIVDVRPADLTGFVQCHFFAGIGGWSYALRLAGWPDEREGWTGSCPCQPWSVAGGGKGATDPRHFWPTWVRLITECRPPTIFGEQVASLDGLYWLDAVFDDLEAADYAVGACDLPASSVGAPHLRQRLFFVAYSDGAGLARSRASVCAPAPRSTPDEWRVIAAAISDNDMGALAGHPALSKPMLCKSDDGVPEWMVQVRGYGNAIVPQVAAEVIAAYMEITA